MGIDEILQTTERDGIILQESGHGANERKKKKYEILLSYLSTTTLLFHVT